MSGGDPPESCDPTAGSKGGDMRDPRDTYQNQLVPRLDTEQHAWIALVMDWQRAA